jgi:hypothetical protein
MSKLTSLFLIIIFFICLFVGIYLGGIVKPPDEPPPPILPEPSNGIIPIGSVLVLGVNNFEDEKIYLESIWLARISTNSDTKGNHVEVDLVGLYPLSAGQVTNPNQSQYVVPHPPINFPKAYLDDLNARELLNTVPILNRTDFFFEDVVVLDEYGMNYIIELTNINPQLPPPPPTESTFFNPWEDPQHAHDIQHNILEIICDPPQNILKYTNFTRVFDIMPHHIVSTISPDDILALWQVNINLNTPPTISCNIFP